MDLFKKLQNMEILLIDDDEWIRDSLSMFFESEGCHLTALETAEEGMEALKKHDFDNLSRRLQIAGYGWPGVPQAHSRYAAPYHDNTHHGLQE